MGQRKIEKIIILGCASQSNGFHIEMELVSFFNTYDIFVQWNKFWQESAPVIEPWINTNTD
jgi:hypothetical protein